MGRADKVKAKRKWCYVLPPYMFDIQCDKCGGTKIDWSEYEHKIWCYDCEIDTDGTSGVFDGPIPIQTSRLLGITFDRINLETEQLERFNLETCEWDPPEVWQKYERTKKQKTVDMIRGNKYENPYGDHLYEEGKKYFELVPAKENEDGNVIVTVTKKK